LSNDLKNEKSPYLKQHENNPVEWLPWNKKTLTKAKDQKKPIFLSVGYASCHWCHVMAHESFENEEIAKIMNEKFINIKVDREERPDLDFIFQRSLGILTGIQGGWPLSMFLDENAVPFTGGTYFPPVEMQGRPSFTNVLNNVSKVYEENRNKIIDQAPQLEKIIDELNRKTAVLNQDLEPFIEKILGYLDEQNGGFKGAPKFPQFYVFDTIFYFYLKNKNKSFLTSVEKLLNNISSKGIYDQLEGGIARYTVDHEWIVPHFEKMLYDNALFVNLLNHFYQSTNNLYFKHKLEQTVKFINSEFLNENNLYGSAYDADSDGVEGKYYIWSYDELQKILGKDLNILEKKYIITKEGNFENSNILVEKVNAQILDDEKNKLVDIENKLLLERKKRNKPFFDNKSQTDLNSLWLFTNLHTSIILEDKNLLKNTQDKINILSNKLSKKIYHCYEKDDKEIEVFLEDYVYYGLLLISLYEINGDNSSLTKCLEIMKNAWELFLNNKSGCLQKNPIKKNDLFTNPVDISDNNIPNGNSIYIYIINKLYNITADKFWKDKIEILQKTFHSLINYNFSQMFSYIKTLDICDENITFTFNGNVDNLKEIKDYILKNYFGRYAFIYKNVEENNCIIICKKQTCSKKLISLDEVKEFLKSNSI
tara:strand:- start:2044 stop:3996 length:1953 start_codon:yes stop_codon:yes gene_type:complete